MVKQSCGVAKFPYWVLFFVVALYADALLLRTSSLLLPQLPV